MEAAEIKWIYNLKIGDKIFYKRDNYSKVKMSIITGISKKCIYAEKLRIKKYPLYMYTNYSCHSSIYYEPIRLIKENNISEEDKIELEKEYFVEQIINKRLLEKLTIEELKTIYDKIN